MYIPFEQLSAEARIWVYQASRPLEVGESEKILEETRAFLAPWASHGNPLQGSATILYNQFLVLAVEESFKGATGCAVDASVQFIRVLEQTFQIDLLDRTRIAFRQNGEQVLVPLSELKENIQQGSISADMLTFDNTVTKKADLEDKWLVLAKDSWLSSYY